MTTKTRKLLNVPTRRKFLGIGVVASMTATAALLSACGQKGPLYIPGEDTKKKKKS